MLFLYETVIERFSFRLRMPFETASAICSILMGGIFEKYPNLRVAFAHGKSASNLKVDLVKFDLMLGGGSFPFTLGRIDHGHECRPDLCAYKNAKRPSSYIGRFYVDSLVHDSRALKFLVEIIGENFVTLGSDYPFPLGEEKPGELILETFQNNRELCEKLLMKNAQVFFKL